MDRRDDRSALQRQMLEALHYMERCSAGANSWDLGDRIRIEIKRARSKLADQDRNQAIKNEISRSGSKSSNQDRH
jgi:hypothetical protein